MSGYKISATIITLNEERDLPRALGSVKGLVDEIVVVDSGSIDKTVEIARKFGARVYFRKFDNFANQKNYAAQKANGDWILSLDADEEVSPELASEIRSLIASEPFGLGQTNHRSQVSAYSMPRKNIIFGKFIRYTRWQPELDRHIWLWRKGRGKWAGDLHAEVLVAGKVSKLENVILHYQYETVSEFMGMMNRYSELDVGEKTRKGVNFSYFRSFFDPLYNFLIRFLYRLGFLDGWRGFSLSYLMAVYHLMVWVKIWERNKVKIINQVN